MKVWDCHTIPHGVTMSYIVVSSSVSSYSSESPFYYPGSASSSSSWSWPCSGWCCVAWQLAYVGLSLDFFLHAHWNGLRCCSFYIAGQLSFLRSMLGCLPGPFFPQYLHLSWADTLSWTLLTWLLESPPLNIFRQAFPVSLASTKVMVSSRGMQAQVTERLHTAARPLKWAANCWTGSSLSWLAVIKASVFTFLLCLTTAIFLISVSLREICEMQSSSFYLDRRITGPWVL